MILPVIIVGPDTVINPVVRRLIASKSAAVAVEPVTVIATSAA